MFLVGKMIYIHAGFSTSVLYVYRRVHKKTTGLIWDYKWESLIGIFTKQDDGIIQAGWFWLWCFTHENFDITRARVSLFHLRHLKTIKHREITIRTCFQHLATAVLLNPSLVQEQKWVDVGYKQRTWQHQPISGMEISAGRRPTVGSAVAWLHREDGNMNKPEMRFFFCVAYPLVI